MNLSNIKAAQSRIATTLSVTPLLQAYLDSFRQGALYLKAENMHRTGSFKERGALNKLLLLKEAKKVHGVVTASAGNHALALSYHGTRLGFKVTVVMPEASPLTKVLANQKWGAHVKLFGSSFDEAVEHAHTLVTPDQPFVHAFDDEDVISGQGTLGLELLSQLTDIQTVIIPVGGGGLASGTAMAIKETVPKCRIIGVQTESHAFTYNAFYGFAPPKKMPHPTIGDGIAVKSVGIQTLPILKKYLDDMVTVSEEEMANGVLHLMETSKMLAEGAGASAMAALLAGKVKGDHRTVVIVSGGNIDVTLISRIIEKGLVKTHRLVRMDVLVPDRPGGLKGLTTLLAELKANILQIHHQRATTHIPLYATGTELTLETKGEEHIREIESTLLANGYQIKIID